jgi:hypothetical protein
MPRAKSAPIGHSLGGAHRVFCDSAELDQSLYQLGPLPMTSKQCAKGYTRNVEIIAQLEQAANAQRSTTDRMADAISRFVGPMVSFISTSFGLESGLCSERCPLLGRLENRPVSIHILNLRSFTGSDFSFDIYSD